MALNVEKLTSPNILINAFYNFLSIDKFGSTLSVKKKVNDALKSCFLGEKISQQFELFLRTIVYSQVMSLQGDKFMSIKSIDNI